MASIELAASLCIPEILPVGGLVVSARERGFSMKLSVDSSLTGWSSPDRCPDTIPPCRIVFRSTIVRHQIGILSAMAWNAQYARCRIRCRSHTLCDGRFQRISSSLFFVPHFCRIPTDVGGARGGELQANGCPASNKLQHLQAKMTVRVGFNARARPTKTESGNPVALARSSN